MRADRDPRCGASLCFHEVKNLTRPTRVRKEFR